MCMQGASVPAVEASSRDGYTLWTARQSTAPSQQAAQPTMDTASTSPSQGRCDALPQRQDMHRPTHPAPSHGRQSRWDRPACQADMASSCRSRRDEASQGSAPAGNESQDRRKRCREEHRCSTWPILGVGQADSSLLSPSSLLCLSVLSFLSQPCAIEHLSVCLHPRCNIPSLLVCVQS